MIFVLFMKCHTKRTHLHFDRMMTIKNHSNPKQTFVHKYGLSWRRKISLKSNTIYLKTIFEKLKLWIFIIFKSFNICEFLKLHCVLWMNIHHSFTIIIFNNVVWLETVNIKSIILNKFIQNTFVNIQYRYYKTTFREHYICTFEFLHNMFNDIRSLLKFDQLEIFYIF